MVICCHWFSWLFQTTSFFTSYLLHYSSVFVATFLVWFYFVSSLVASIVFLSQHTSAVSRFRSSSFRRVVRQHCCDNLPTIRAIYTATENISIQELADHSTLWCLFICALKYSYLLILCDIKQTGTHIIWSVTNQLTTLTFVAQAAEHNDEHYKRWIHLQFVVGINQQPAASDATVWYSVVNIISVNCRPTVSRDRCARQSVTCRRLSVIGRPRSCRLTSGGSLSPTLVNVE